MATNGYVGAPYAPGSDTSRAAAEAIVGRTAAGRAQVLALFVEAGPAGLADHEIEDALGETRSRSCRPRRKELVDLGAIVKTDERRPTPSGRSAGVYRLAPPAETSMQP